MLDISRSRVVGGRTKRAAGGKRGDNEAAAACLSLPPGLELVKRPTTFYVGNDSYKIDTDFDSVQLHQHYVQYVMNNVHGFVSRYNYTTGYGVRSNYTKIISFMFKTILGYNKIVAPYRFSTFDCATGPALLGEPVTYLKSASGDVKLYFSKIIIERVLDRDIQHVAFKFSDDMNETGRSSRSLNIGSGTRNTSTEQLAHQSLLYKLFIIADHLATHYIDEYVNGSTDWINHFKFGSGPCTTTHTVFKLTSAVVSGANKPILFSYSRTDVGPAFVGPAIRGIPNPITEPTSLLNQLY